MKMLLLTMLICTSSMFAQNYIFNSVITNSNIGDSSDTKGKASVKIVTKNIALKKSFSAININTAGDISIHKSLINRLSIKTDKNLIDKCSVYIENDILFIKTKSSFISSNGLNIDIGSSKLNKLTIIGASNVKVKDYNIDNFTLNIDGASDVYFSSNSINRLNIKADGSYDINLLNSKIKEATIRASGSGDIKIDVTNSLNIKIDGSTDIKYRGNPKISKEINGVADLIKIK